jgi:hypothetical protein
MSSWIQHVKAYSKEHGISYKQALSEAGKTYKKVSGGALDSKTLKKALNESYDQDNKDIGDFQVDEHLSGRRVKVYNNPITNQTIVSHRGTANLKDWGTDALMAVGIENTNRFKHSKKIQKEAEKKYGRENVSTVGHSLGARLAEKYGNNSKEIMTLNKPTTLKTAGKRIRNKQTDIRSSRDVVSGLHRTGKKNKYEDTIDARTYNPLKEHGINILNRRKQTVYGIK